MEITLNANGGDCDTKSITVNYGSKYGELPVPAERAGYNFDGWWTTKTTGGKQVTKDTVCYATGNFTLYARWKEAATYTVTLNANGGTCTPASITVTYGNTYAMLPTPAERTGYNFDGWWTTKATGGKQVTASTVCYATGNFTLYARWKEAATHTVTLNANGGTCSTGSITVTYGNTYGMLPTPAERTGYNFDGWWTTKSTGGKQVTKDTVCYATGNFTLYARWKEAATHTVTLNANGGTCATTSITVTYKNTYGTLPTPTRRGYKFAGWWTTKATGGKQVTASTVCYATGNFTLYARWTELASYTVTLNSNGGTCSTSSVTVYYSQTYGTLPTPTRRGYKFDGWWTTKTTGGKQVTASTVCYATGNFTMYARWTALASYTVTLNANGGSCSTPNITVYYSQTYGTLPTPTRRGYKFDGWWTTKTTGGKQVTKDTVCYASGNFTLYARWTALASYTITLNPNGGNCTTSNITVYYSQTYGALPTPTREGYTFDGWWTTKATGGKQVTASTVCYATGNFTLYARWTALASYTVTLNSNGGTCSQSSVTVYYSQTYGTLPEPTRRGCKFAGWWTTRDSGGKQVTASTVCYATGNFTLYARWTALASYTVTLNPNGGTCDKSSITVYYSQAYGTLPTPTREGYTFAGWWTTKATGGKEVTKNTVCYATGNFTLYARWTQN